MTINSNLLIKDMIEKKMTNVVKAQKIGDGFKILVKSSLYFSYFSNYTNSVPNQLSPLTFFAIQSWYKYLFLIFSSPCFKRDKRLLDYGIKRKGYYSRHFQPLKWLFLVFTSSMQ
jgi:hypothetical protein